MKQFYLLIVLLLLTQACKKEEGFEYKTTSGAVFGTTYSIIYQSKKEYQKSIDSLFHLVNKSLSTYLPSSYISRVNNNDSTVVVDDFFVEVFKKSKRIYKETNGYFDPTFGIVIDAYGFGSGKRKDSITKKDIAELMNYVGFEKISIKNRRVYKELPKIQINVNAIAKGYGIDVIARFLETQKIENYLVEIGGEVRAKGVSKRNKPWRVAIDDPNTDGSRTVSKFVSLTNQSVASSGNYRKFRVDKNGKKYVHTINPKTGLAKENDLLSATVITSTDCADADAYATAFMAMGFEKTKEFLKRYPKINALLVYVNTSGEIKNYKSY